jgi:hypothetical protein
MAEESFADQEVARFLNRHYVAVKVDREERPDVDHIYMAACQAMTGSGGWPLTIVMTAQGQPFFAGTYFPRRSKYGRPGLLEVLQQIVSLWQGDRQRLLQVGAHMVTALERLSSSFHTDQMSHADRLSGKILEEVSHQLKDRFDEAHGGFGAAPKFPTPHNLTLLLRWWRRSGQQSALNMVVKTLDGMWQGGIYDHLGFGFHRYATDAGWQIPHFEKMLYDQALLSLAYLEAYQATGRARYARVAREVCGYVLGDMTSPEGGFYSAQDADSEGQEGRYYLWSSDQIRSVLGKEAGERFGRFFGVTAEGNFEEGTNILHRTEDLETFAPREKMSPRQLERFLETSRRKLLAARQERVPPLKDDKILTDWNGLMIAALARGGAVLDDSDYVHAAERASEFLLGPLRRTDGRLLHRYRDGQASIPGFLDDYTFLMWGLIELYEATFGAQHLSNALVLADQMLELFRDDAAGGLSFTGQDAERLVVQPKEITDGAVPSGNSVAALSLLRLSRLTGRARLEARAGELMDGLAHQVSQVPTGFSHLLMALDFALGPAHEVVIAGDPAKESTRRMLAALRARFLPGAVVLLHDPGPEGRALRELVPTVESQIPIHGKAAAYVCHNFACRRPVTDVEEMLAALEGESGD